MHYIEGIHFVIRRYLKTCLRTSNILNLGTCIYTSYYLLELEYLEVIDKKTIRITIKQNKISFHISISFKSNTYEKYITNLLIMQKKTSLSQKRWSHALKKECGRRSVRRRDVKRLRRNSRHCKKCIVKSKLTYLLSTQMVDNFSRPTAYIYVST